MSNRRALALLIAIPAALRLILAASIGPGNDEAYYTLYADHLDWSYFDHPPLVGWIVAATRLLALGPRSIFLDRLGFVALFAGSTFLIARLTARWFDPRAGVAAALALNVTLYFGIAAGTFVLPDGPLLFFWLLTLDRLTAALDQPRQLSGWAVLGLAWGGALLSKYQAVLLPVGTLLFLCLDSPSRPVLRRVGPYLALAIGLLVALPVWIWNTRHGGSSLAFQGARAIGVAFMPWNAPLTWLAQIAYLGPWIGWSLTRLLWRSRRSNDPAARFFACQAAPLLMLILAISCGRIVFPHWSLVGYACLLPLLARDWAAALALDSPRMRRRLALVAVVPIVLAALLIAQARMGLLQGSDGRLLGFLPHRADPTRDLDGWNQIAREIRRLASSGNAPAFVFAGHWSTAAQLRYVLGDEIPVLCYNAGDARGFADWHDPDAQLGSDALLVAVDDRSIEPGCYAPYFRRIVPFNAFSVHRGGAAIRSVRLFHAVGQTRPFPYTRVHTSRLAGRAARKSTTR